MDFKECPEKRQIPKKSCRFHFSILHWTNPPSLSDLLAAEVQKNKLLHSASMPILHWRTVLLHYHFALRLLSSLTFWKHCFFMEKKSLGWRHSTQKTHTYRVFISYLVTLLTWHRGKPESGSWHFCIFWSIETPPRPLEGSPPKSGISPLRKTLNATKNRGIPKSPFALGLLGQQAFGSPFEIQISAWIVRLHCILTLLYLINIPSQQPQGTLKQYCSKS